jgi:ABC-2 type transport system ATP-binding protein
MTRLPSEREAIEAEGLTRYYGERPAVDHVTFSVGRGEIFGFLGPNGAGKSTTVRMLTGFLAPSEGSVRLAGIDMAEDPTAARELVGVVPEEANVYADLTVWQNVMLMAELHRVGRRRRTKRGAELLYIFGLGDRRRQKGRELSKGLRQRLMLCAALVSDPDILFLDEPTSGLDVASAHLIREIVVRLNRERGMTVFITTHNLEEAGNLCHRVAIIDRGRLVAIDTPQHLRSTVESRQSVEVRFEGATVLPGDLLDGLTTAEVVPLADGFRVYTAQPGPLAQEIATRASAKGLRLAALSTRAPSLEDVFLHITTHGLAPREEVAHVGC